MFIGLIRNGAEIGSNIALRYAPYLYAGYRFMTSRGLTDGAAKVASDISWLMKQPYNYLSSVNTTAITGLSECVERAAINQTYGNFDHLIGKSIFGFFREKAGQGKCIWDCAENIYYLGMGIGFTLCSIHVGKKVVKASNRFLHIANKLSRISKGALGATNLIYTKTKSTLNAVVSKLFSNKELKLTEEDQTEILDVFKQLSGLGRISLAKIFNHNNKLNVRFQIELPLDQFLDRIKGLGLEPTSVLKDENEKALLIELFSRKNYRLQFVSN